MKIKNVIKFGIVASVALSPLLAVAQDYALDATQATNAVTVMTTSLGATGTSILPIVYSLLAIAGVISVVKVLGRKAGVRFN